MPVYFDRIFEVSEISIDHIPITKKTGEDTSYDFEKGVIFEGNYENIDVQTRSAERVRDFLPSITLPDAPNDYKDSISDFIRDLPKDLQSSVVLRSYERYKGARNPNLVVGFLPGDLPRIKECTQEQKHRFVYEHVITPTLNTTNKLPHQAIELLQEIGKLATKSVSKEQNVNDLANRARVHEQKHYVTLRNRFEGRIGRLFDERNELPYISKKESLDEKNRYILEHERLFNTARGLLEAESKAHQMLGSSVIDDSQVYEVTLNQTLDNIGHMTSEFFRKDHEGGNISIINLLESPAPSIDSRSYREHAMGTILLLLSDRLDFNKYAQSGSVMESLKEQTSTEDLVLSLLNLSKQMIEDQEKAKTLLLRNYDYLQKGIEVFSTKVADFQNKNLPTI